MDVCKHFRSGDAWYDEFMKNFFVLVHCHELFDGFIRYENDDDSGPIIHQVIGCGGGEVILLVTEFINCICLIIYQNNNFLKLILFY